MNKSILSSSLWNEREDGIDDSMSIPTTAVCRLQIRN